MPTETELFSGLDVGEDVKPETMYTTMHERFTEENLSILKIKWNRQPRAAGGGITMMINTAFTEQRIASID